MTPLAHQLVKRSTLPKVARPWFDDTTGVLGLLDEIHCFEVTQVQEAAMALLAGPQYVDPELPPEWAEKWQDSLYPETAAARAAGEIEKPQPLSERGREVVGQLKERLAFLPFPMTWIEHHDPVTKQRWVHHLMADPKLPGWVRVRTVGDDRSWLSYSFALEGDFNNPVTPVAWYLDHPLSGDEQLIVGQEYPSLLIYLAMINTPRIIGRVQHAPHLGLQRRLAQLRTMPGRFPLHAWTEIKLEVHPPRLDDGAAPELTGLTGQRALHWVRAHLRFWRGELVFVSAHLRGNPALGLKRSRYAVIPPPGGNPP